MFYIMVQGMAVLYSFDMLDEFIMKDMEAFSIFFSDEDRDLKLFEVNRKARMITIVRKMESYWWIPERHCCMQIQ